MRGTLSCGNRVCCFIKWWPWHQEQQKYAGKKQLRDRGQRKRNNLFWTISNKLVTTVPGDRSCLSPPRWHAWANKDIHAHTGTHTSVWVRVSGIICNPQTVTSWKPSQNILIKVSPTITARPGPSPLPWRPLPHRDSPARLLALSGFHLCHIMPLLSGQNLLIVLLCGKNKSGCLICHISFPVFSLLWWGRLPHKC